MQKEKTRMIGRMTALVAFGTLLCSSAWAQDHRFEISGTAGYVLADGVSAASSVLGADGNLYNRVDPKDSFGWGIGIGYFFTETSELEFLYSNQPSTLTISGTASRDVGDFSIKGYHGVYSYHFGEPEGTVRPFISFGLGATSYPGVTFTGFDGQTRQTDGNTQFSGTLGLGVKIYPGNGKAGLRLQTRWTPTYIKSDSEGWWCDPYWGCYVVGDPQYSNQFELSGGISLRF